MAKKGVITGRIKLEGASEYRKTLGNIAASEKELQSEMKKTSEQFKDNGKSEDALIKKHEQLTAQIELQKKKLEAHRAMITAAAAEQEKQAKSIEKMREEYAQSQKTLQKMTDAGEGASEAAKKLTKEIEQQEDKLQIAEEAYADVSRQLSGYKASANDAETEIFKLNRRLDETRDQIQELNGVEIKIPIIEELNDGEKKTTFLQQIAGDADLAGERIRGIGDIIKANLASEVIADGARATVSAIKTISEAAIETGESFEAAMSLVAATMGITADEIETGSEAYNVLKTAAQECGERTKYSATESAEALNYLALAGYDAEKSAELLPKVLNLAAAGGLDLAKASDMVTDAMAALGMETGRVDEYIDQMATTAQKSNTSVEQLGEATLTVAGMAASVSMDLNTMNAELGILANNGIKGAEGGTHLRNVLQALVAPSDKAADTLEELGIEVEDADGNIRNLNDILTDLNTSMDGMGDAQRTRIISTIFNRTDISAVNALLKGTNGEFQNLSEQLQNCSGAASNMAETMNNNLRGKLTILQSSLEALGISAYEIFDEELKGGTEAAIDAVSRLNRSVKEGDMNVSLNKLSDAIGNLIEEGSGLLEDVLPDLIEKAAWFIENLDLVISLVGGVVAANMTMKVIIPILAQAQAAWLAYRGANEGATVSQWAMNAAMSANPIGAVVAGVTALTTALIIYTGLNNDAAQSVDYLTEEQRKLVETNQKLIDSVKESSDIRKADIDDIDAQKRTTKELVQELDMLRNKTSLTTDEQRRMGLIVNELNTMLPELNLYYDEQTGELNMSTEAIEKNTDALWRQAEAQAYQEMMTDLLRERIEVEQQLAELEEEYNGALEENTRICEQWREAKEALTEATKEGSDATSVEIATLEAAEEAAWNNWETTLRSNGEIINSYDQLQSELDGLDGQYDLLNERIGDTGSYEEATEALTAMSEATKEASEIATLTEEQYSSLYSAVSESIAGQIDIFSEYTEAVAQSKQDILRNMEDQVAAMEAWADNMKALAERGIDRGLLEKLAAMGPEGAGYVAAFIDMTDEELQKASGLFEEAYLMPEAVAKEITDTYEQTGYQAWMAWKEGYTEGANETAEACAQDGENIAGYTVDGYMEGVENRISDIEESGENVGYTMLNGLRDSMLIHSPSEAMRELGEYSIEGLIEGLEDPERIELVKQSSGQLGELVKQEIRAKLNKSIFYEYGKDVGIGLEEGIKSKIEDVRKAAEALAAAASAAAKARLDINSPSKVFRYFGEMSGEGYIEGLEYSLRDINGVMDSFIPEISKEGAAVTGGPTINQDINIYSMPENLSDMERKFRQAQREAAEEW